MPVVWGPRCENHCSVSAPRTPPPPEVGWLVHSPYIFISNAHSLALPSSLHDTAPAASPVLTPAPHGPPTPHSVHSFLMLCSCYLLSRLPSPPPRPGLTTSSPSGTQLKRYLPSNALPGASPPQPFTASNPPPFLSSSHWTPCNCLVSA